MQMSRNVFLLVFDFAHYFFLKVILLQVFLFELKNFFKLKTFFFFCLQFLIGMFNYGLFYDICLNFLFNDAVH